MGRAGVYRDGQLEVGVRPSESILVICCKGRQARHSSKHVTHRELCCARRLSMQNQPFQEVRVQQWLLCKLCHATIIKGILLRLLRGSTLSFLSLFFSHSLMVTLAFSRSEAWFLHLSYFTLIDINQCLKALSYMSNYFAGPPALVLHYLRSRAQRLHLCCVCVYTNGDPCVQTLHPRSGGLHLFGQQN